MFEMIFTPPTKVMIIGAACSAVSQATAQSAHLWNLTQVAFGSSAPALSDRKTYPRFFRVSASELTSNDVRMLLVHLFKWKKIATIHESLAQFTDVTYDLVERCKRENITVTTVEIFKGDPTLQVENLKRHDARIIVGGFYENKARQIVCQAYKLGMRGPKVVWFLPGWYSNNWWQVDDPSISCSRPEMDLAVEGHILTTRVMENPLQTRSIAGYTPREWVDAFFDYYNVSREDGVVPRSSCYDAVWAGALGLDQTDRQLKKSNFSKSLNEFTYADGHIADVLTQSMYNVAFWGIQGHVNIGPDGSCILEMTIDHVTGGRRYTVGVYLPETKNKLKWLGDGITWSTGRVPRDSVVISYVKRRVSLQIYLPICGIAGAGVLLAAAFIAINTVFRKSRTVKMSSPALNNVILLGCVLMLMSVTLEPQSDTSALPMCMTRQYLLALGFSLVYGGLFSKTWRVYRIFFNKGLRRLNIRDNKLFLCVITLATLNVSTLVLWDIADRKHIVTINSTREVSPEDEDVITQNQMDVCLSEWSGYFTGAFYSINGIVLLIGAFLAWQTRKVHIQELNDSRQVGMCVYNTVILSGVAVAVSECVQFRQDLLYGLTSALLLAGTLLTQLIIFFPKIFSIREDRRRVEISSMNSSVDRAQQLRVTDVTGVDVSSREIFTQNTA